MIHHSAPTLGQEESEAAARAVGTGQLAQGPEVQAFEEECAAFVGRRHAVAVSSGTAALHLALGALGVRRPDCVAVPSYACAALITAVELQGGRPVLIDNKDDGNMSPIVPHECTHAIVPHMFGKPAPVPFGMAIVEDIAQSLGGSTGSATAVAITSFYATKLMTTGEGGMVLTDTEAIAAYARDRRDYDNRALYLPRNNYKMTEMQAAVGRVQLRRLPDFLKRRRELAEKYEEELAGLPLQLPAKENHVFFRYVITAEDANGLIRHLALNGIEAKRPVYRPAHHYIGGTCPGADKAHQCFVSLPIYPSLSDAECETVAAAVRSYFEG